MKIILCDDILELVGKEVNKIRNIQWWIDNYGYHLPNYKFILNHNQLKRKDTNSTHAVKIALQFNHYINTNHSDIIPHFYKGVLDYTLYTWHGKFECDSYGSLPSKRYMEPYPHARKNIQEHI